MNGERARVLSASTSMSQGCVRMSNVSEGEEMNVLGCQMFPQGEGERAGNNMFLLGCQMFLFGIDMFICSDMKCFHLK